MCNADSGANADRIIHVRHRPTFSLVAGRSGAATAPVAGGDATDDRRWSR